MAKKILTLDQSSEELSSMLHRIGDKDGKMFVVYEDILDECFRFFHSDEEAEAWSTERDIANAEGRSMDPVIAAYEFAGNYIPGTPNFSASITPIYGDGIKALEGSTGNYIQFRPSIIDRSKNDTSESIDVYITISNDAMSRNIYEIHKSNELVTVNIDDYISLGDNDIAITIKGRASGAGKTVVMTYNIFRLTVDSSFNIANTISPNKNFSVNYTVKGNGQKQVFFFIDGVESYNPTVSAGDTDYTASQTIANTDGRLAPGKHTLQIYAVSNGYPSDLLYYEFVIGGMTSPFTCCLVKYVFPSGTPVFTGDVPGFSGTQYVPSKLEWAYYTNEMATYTGTDGVQHSLRTPKITWRLFKNGVETHLATREADVVEAVTDKMPDPVEFMPDGYGNYRLQAIIEGYNYLSPYSHHDQGGDHEDPLGLIACYSISVEKNEQVQEQTDGRILKYSGLGRSNDEPEDTRLDLSDNGIKANIVNNPFNGLYGYHNNAIVSGGGAYITVPVNPLSSEYDVRSHGNTTEVDFMVTDVRTTDTPVFQIGALTDYHIAIFPDHAELKTNLGTKVSVSFREQERHKIAFVTYPDDETLSGTNIRMMMLYVDGVRTAAVQYGQTDVMYNTASQIVIGDFTAQSTFHLYYLRIFNTVVTHYRILDHFIIDSGSNIQTLVKRNDIYTEGSHSELSVSKLRGIIPTWEMTGPFDNLFVASQDKTAFSASGKYTDPQNPDIYMEGADFEVKPSGESSLSDNMVKGFHLKFNKGNNQIYNSDGKPYQGNRWTPFSGNVPERKVRNNADGLESSHTHNAVLQTIINEVFRKVQVAGQYVLRTPAQAYVQDRYAIDMVSKFGGAVTDYTFPYKINYASDWKPVAIMWRPDSDSPYSLLGIFSMGEEKKSDYTHGRRSIYLKKLDNGTLDPFDFYSGVKGERGYNNDGIIQIEFVRDSSITFMTDISNFESDKADDMEKVYPDEDDQTAEENNADWNIFRDEVLQPVSALYTNTEIDANGVPWAKGNQTGFHNLLFGGTFNVWSYLAARIIIRACGLTDTYVRNSQWLRLPSTYGATNSSWTWWFAYWDLDMALGLQQPSGALVIDPCLDRTDKVDGNFVFTGKQNTTQTSSWWWDAFDEELRLGKLRIENATSDAEMATAQVDNLYYMERQLMDALADAGFTPANISSQMKVMANSFGEALYNADGQAKYLDSFGRGSNYLLRLQGSRISHMMKWIYDSFERWDAEFVTKRYQANAVAFRLVNNLSTDKIKIKAAAHSFFGFGATTTILKSGVELNTGDTVEWAVGRTLNANDPLQIYVPNKIESLDCSDFANVISGNIELKPFYNSESESMTIRTLNIGVPVDKMAQGVFNNASNKTWTLPDKGLYTLESININGYRYVSDTGSINLSGFTSLTTFHAIGATGLTSVTPASGTHIADYRLPDTIKSLVLVSNTIGTNGITFWKDTKVSDSQYTIQQMTGVPSSLTTLQMTQGMGDDTEAHNLFKDWLDMVGQQEDPAQYRIVYSNVDVRNMSIDQVLLLAQMKKTLSSSVSITGYIHCSTEYTADQMATLMEAFGTDIFSRSSILCFDCNSNKVIVSASGSDTSVYTEGDTIVVEVLQGTSATLQAVGFPLLANGVEYQWYEGASYNTGNSVSPLIPIDSNSIHYKTGEITTVENNAETKDYSLLVRRLLDGEAQGNGTATLRIKARTYPTDASTSFNAALSSSAVEIGGVLTIANTGHYIFDADHTPEGYNGTMQSNGGVWTVEGISGLPGIQRCELSNDASHNKDNRYCLQIGTIPQGETNVVIKYVSKWKNGLELTANDLALILIATIENVLTNDTLFGNPPLFAILDTMGVSHSKTSSYNSLELRQMMPDSAIHFAQTLIDAGLTAADLVSVFSNQHNVLTFLTNVSTFDFSDCAGLTGDIDITSVPWVKKIDMSNTGTNNIVGVSGKENLASISYNQPSIIEISNCQNLNIN